MAKKMIIAVIMGIIILLLIPQAAAWGDLTHYSIGRDAGLNTTEELSAAGAPDVLLDFNYGSDFLDTFVHLELPDVLYGPLDYYMFTGSAEQDRWAAGWMSHTVSDRRSHGTFEKSANKDPDHNYLKAAGADTLKKHLEAEFASDVLSYWLNQGTVPEKIIIYPDHVRSALNDYDAYCKTNYLQEYDQEKYLVAFESHQAAIYAEQILIDYNQDKKVQLVDRALLIWAYQKYYDPYSVYYPKSVDDVKLTTRPLTPPECSFLTIPATDSAVEAEIHINVGRQLIDNGMIAPYKKFDEGNGTIIMEFKLNVTGQELAKSYLIYLEKAYKEQTGKKLNIQDEINSRKIYITSDEIKKSYPELNKKLIEKGIVEEDMRLIEYIKIILIRYLSKL